jgi:broad specificity phosphatase PhoE
MSTNTPGRQALTRAKQEFRLKARLTLICHGATASNRTATFPADEPLEDKAIGRTALLARQTAGAARIWISPAHRAVQTAAILDLAGEVTPALRDCDYGRWTGKTFETIHAEDPDGLASWMRVFDVAPHGGESLSMLFGRVAGWLDERLADRGHAVVITHASVIRACLLHVLGAAPQAFWKIDVEPLSVTELSGDGRRWALRLASDLERA